MDDIIGRVLVVAAVVAISLLIVRLLKGREAAPYRRIKSTGLSPGVYFFSSAACGDCGPVRTSLIERLGPEGFVEFSWERDPAFLEKLTIEGVPATLVVEESGHGRLWPGDAESMFRSLILE